MTDKHSIINSPGVLFYHLRLCDKHEVNIALAPYYWWTLVYIGSCISCTILSEAKQTVNKLL